MTSETADTDTDTNTNTDTDTNTDRLTTPLYGAIMQYYYIPHK